MRYEIPSFRVDKVDFLKGGNSYDDYPDGGFLASSSGMNVFSKPGLLTVSPSLGSTVASSLPANGVISWGVGSGTSSPSVVGVISNTSNHGYFGSVNPTTGVITLVGSADTTHSYRLGITDTVFYNGYFLTTSETDICRNNPDLSSRITNWWTGTKSQPALTAGVPHPMVVYESIAYVADGRYLHSIDGDVVSYQVWDAPPDHVITALVEWNGLIYIVAEPYSSLTGSVHGLSQMFSWDGLSDSWYEQYLLDYRVNSLYVFKNNLYCWTNDFMGLWTGSEMRPVRPVSNQVFKSQITTTSNSLLYADGRNIIRFGVPYIPGLSRKFYPYLFSVALNFAGILSAAGNNLIMSEKHATASPLYLVSNLDTPGSSNVKTFDLNHRSLKKPVKVRGVVVEMQALTTGQSIKIEYVNDKGETKTPAESGTINTEGATFKRFDVLNGDATRLIRPKITITGGAHIRSVDYLFEASEDKQNK